MLKLFSLSQSDENVSINSLLIPLSLAAFHDFQLAQVRLLL